MKLVNDTHLDIPLDYDTRLHDHLNDNIYIISPFPAE